MKTRSSLYLLLCFLLIAASCGKSPKSKFKYDTYTNDPLNTKIYTLKNGLRIYMTVNKDAPRISTSIAVRTGSKNDPADATGLAHYLEHMLFKGTDKYGTIDYAKEEPLLNKIEELFEIYRTKKDPAERAAIYAQIDSLSQEASKYAIAGEYDKMMSEMGATGTNAYTSFEQTVYINDIPSNQLKRWLELEAERFRKPVLRLFHTELEAVYEEKNISLDNDYSKVYETLYASLFKNHNYGKQTTIGTVEHLKNPSLKKIREYFNTYYVPNNMAIILAGDFEPDSAVTWAERFFGAFQKKEVPKYIFDEEEESKPEMLTVYGPDAESVTIGYRLKGYRTSDGVNPNDDRIMLELVDMILSNRTAGLIDINLKQQQRVMNPYSSPDQLTDYSIEYLGGSPKTGQTLDEVRDLLLAQIDSVKKGAFPDWLIPAVIKDLKLSQTQQFEYNWGRGSLLTEVFVNQWNYDYHVNRYDKLSKMTKQDVVKFANEKFKDNYTVIYKKTGADPNVIKVDKPKITPVDIKRDTASAFCKHIVSQPVAAIEPVFVDFKKEVNEVSIQQGVNMYYHQNATNNLFSLTYLVDIGSKTDKILPVAIKYLDYLGTGKYSPIELKQEFYKSGCSFSVFSATDKVYITLSGLQEDFTKGLELFEHLLTNAKPNPDALKNLVQDMIKKRADDKLDKYSILWGAMYSYAKYGADNPSTFIFNNAELEKIPDSVLIQSIKSIESFEHKILYYGPATSDDVVKDLKQYHKVPAQLKPVPAERDYPEMEIQNQIYFINYDMQQAEIVMLSKDVKFDKALVPMSYLYNEYFGGGLSSVVFQEIRESKALAYSAYSGFSQPGKPQHSYYIFSYIGTQADKMPEAISGMINLLDSMPQSEKNLETCKKNILENIRTKRITKSSILWNYDYVKRMGYDYDIRKDVYENVPKLTMKDLLAFQAQHIKGKAKVIFMVGDKKKLDLKSLQKYGTVKELSLTEVFGY